MDWQSYWAFVGACVLLVLVPGPDMAYILGRAVAQGRRAGVIAALGVNAGAYVHLVAAVTGLSAILLTSAVAFTTVKLIGAAYLVYIGMKALAASKAKASDTDLRPRARGTIFWQGFLCDALNPKVAVFYLAFLPQFVDPHDPEPIRRLLLLGLTTNMVALPINLVLVLASSSTSGLVRRNSKMSLWLQRTLGLTFVTLGVRLAIERR